MLEQECVFEFLVGLNFELDLVRSRVLGKNSFPSSHQAFSLVCIEESRLEVMMKTPFVPSTKIFALNIMVEKGIVGGEMDLRWCNYYKRSWHIWEKCWRLNGRPQQGNKGVRYSISNKRLNPKFVPTANTTSTDATMNTPPTEDMPFTKE